MLSNVVEAEDEDNLSIGSANSTSDQKMSSICGSISSESLLSISLTEDETSKVTELKKRLGDELLNATPLYNNDHFLLRWILGWDSKWNEIIPRFKKGSQVLESLGTNEIEFETPEEVNEYVSAMYPASEYFVGGLMGFDKTGGNVIVMQSVGHIYPKILVQCGRVSDVFRLSIIEAALTMKLIRQKETLLGKRFGIVIILDLDGLNLDHLYPTTVKVYMNLLRELQDMFPDTARKIFVINAPSIFTIAYNVIKPAIALKTRQRICVLGHNYVNQLCEELGSDCIYPHWGGTKVATRGNPNTGNIRMGGKPPDSLLYVSSNNQFHVDDMGLTKLNVPARSRRTVPIECTQEGQLLQWFFHSSSEIEFSVEFVGEENVIVVPKFKLNTDYVSEYGCVKCKHVGTYLLCFDNYFSRFFSKDIRFHAYFVDENGNEAKIDSEMKE